MTFGRIVQLAWRSVPYLKEVRRDLLRLLLIAAPVLPLAITVGLLAYDLMINRMLLGQPLTSFQATVLLLDPQRFVEVDKLTVASQQILRGQLLIHAGVIAAVATPVGVGLILYVLRTMQRINQVLRVQMVEQVQAMSMRYHAGAQIGDSIYRTYQDSAMVTNILTMLVRPVWPLLRLLYMPAMLLFFDPRISLSLWAMSMFAAGLGWHYGRLLRGDFKHARETNAQLTSTIQETMASLKLVKAFGTGATEQARFERASQEAFDAAYTARLRVATYGILGYTLSAIPTTIAVCFMAVWAAEERALAAGSAAAFLGYQMWTLASQAYATGRASGTTSTVHGLLKMWGELQDMAVGMDRAFREVDLEAEVQDAEDGAPLAPFTRDVSFHGVSFAYQPDVPVLQNVELTAKVGEVTALVGPTGSGKSTLVTLMLRLFDPEEGKIAIDGVDIKRVTLESLRSNIAIALQENLLFGTTIRENIRYAVPDASDAEVREAARIACADGFIEAQPQGYDTPLGERGSKLSTGQRQRLSIARAIIKDTPILILDEPTASLDAETEMKVLGNLAQWGKGRAILVITHRLSTIRRADHIVYMRDGQIVEDGSHDMLMDRAGGAYRRFVELERAEPSGAMPAVAPAGAE